jgi:predicted RNA-binding protein with TRAM domain
MNEQEAPVKEGEQHEVWINSVGGKGDGIAKVKGFVLFVPNVKKGDFVRIRITKVLPKVGFAEVVDQLEKPVRESKFATVTEEEMHEEEVPSEQFEETEDFGADLDDEE